PGGRRHRADREAEGGQRAHLEALQRREPGEAALLFFEIAAISRGRREAGAALAAEVAAGPVLPIAVAEAAGRREAELASRGRARPVDHQPAVIDRRGLG